MKATSVGLEGAILLEPDLHEDERGFFARTYCGEEFRRLSLNPEIAQCSISFNARKGTLRGLHFQIAPHEETKVVRCTMGAVYDVIVDLRPASATFHKWFAIELSARNRKMVYIPVGFAHGFQTLEDNSEVLYQISRPYSPESARGLKWDDPVLGVDWPLADPFLSERDKTHQFLSAPGSLP